jgi:hypothetical protein
MAEYIEREAAMLLPELPKEYRHYQTDNLDDAYEQGWDDALCCLEHIPAADVAPVVHGDWLLRHIGVGHYWECSICHTNPCIYITEHTKFCPNCGARMDGDSNAKAD